MPYIQFLGAAGTVTGSKHLVNCNDDTTGRTGFQVLIDCGLFQGPKEWRERNWQDTPVPSREIDAVVLTHAHLDHTGWIPRLVKEGFKGPIYCTPATAELCSILLPDSGHLQEEDAAFHNKMKSSKHKPALPLYTFAEAQQCLQYFKTVDFGEEKEIAPGVRFQYFHAAHILGSSMVFLHVDTDAAKRTMVFTGDIGRVRDTNVAPGKVVHTGPQEMPDTDLLVMESTYGNREHPTTDPRPELAKLITDTVQRGGSVIVPAFAVERTQKLLFMLKDLMEQGKIPRVPVFADSPMAIQAMDIFMKHSDEFTEETKAQIARYGTPQTWQGFTFASKADESKKINDAKYPSIIVSSSGMATGGRILHHMSQRLPDPKNLILFIGFQSPGTRGAEIKAGAKTVRMYGEEIPVRAQVAALEQFSDHADTRELLEWLRTFHNPPKQTYLVHGEPTASSALQKAITDALKWKVDVAQYMGKVAV